MHLLFVADGERDSRVCPEIVKRVLGAEISFDFRAWKEIRLSRGKGYERKLKFALLQARENGHDGVVATIDADKTEAGQGLQRLRSARDQDRQALPAIPAALGEAVPHLEAWLLDDPLAIREVLQFPGVREIPNVRDVEPKSALDDLCSESTREDDLLDLLAKMATSHDCERCNHRTETGLQEFVDDVKRELGPLTQP